MIFSADNTRQGPLITIFAKPFHNDKGELQGDEFFAVNDKKFFAHFRVFAQGIKFPGDVPRAQQLEVERLPGDIFVRTG